MRLEQWLEIGRAVADAALDPGIDGVVVTHGTFTVEETAFFLHLTVRTDKPIVLVCAQRMRDARGTDGERNLLDAIRTAATPDARGKGVLVVLHEEIHSAREVVKTNQRPGGFKSVGRGLLGHVERDRVSFYHAPLRRHTMDWNASRRPGSRSSWSAAAAVAASRRITTIRSSGATR